jgi:guanylate kinase
MRTPSQNPDSLWTGALVVAGPSGVGKSTIINKVLAERPNWTFSISATTRPLRPTEVEGVDYLHISMETFHERIAHHGFLEYAFVFGNYYGTPRSELDRARSEGKHIIIEIDTVGCFSIRAVQPEIPLVAIVPPSLQILEDRLTSRGTDSEASLRERRANVLAELQRMRWFDFVIVNDEIENAVSRMLSIMDITEGGLLDVPGTLDRVLQRKELSGEA